MTSGKRGDQSTYLQLEKSKSQVNAGRNGSRNCLVMGRTKPAISIAAANVFANGPGDSDTESEKMATMARKRYWASYMDQGCVRSERSVSLGENEVLREEMEDAGDRLLRIRERVALHLRRTRWGMKLGKEARPGIFLARPSMSVAELSRKAR